MRLDEYLKEPCRLLPIPYWKAQTIQIPDTMLILHHKDYKDSYMDTYNDSLYFRLYHDMKSVPSIRLDGYEILTAKDDDISTIVDVINQSYTNIKVDYGQIDSYRKTDVYHENLWIMIRHIASNQIVACAIGDYDREAKELVLEWIQVLEDYRGRGIGQLMVNELLHRMSSIASFATVSGMVDNNTNPERLYRNCGFVGNDVWHIMNKRSESRSVDSTRN